MVIIMILSVIIIAVVIALSVFTVNKGYAFKHTVDPLENNPHLQQEPDKEESDLK